MKLAGLGQRETLQMSQVKGTCRLTRSILTERKPSIHGKTEHEGYDQWLKLSENNAVDFAPKSRGTLRPFGPHA
jgi:hypothetical protein